MTFSVKDWSEAYYRWARCEQRNHTIADNELYLPSEIKMKYDIIITTDKSDVYPAPLLHTLQLFANALTKQGYTVIIKNMKFDGTAKTKYENE